MDGKRVKVGMRPPHPGSFIRKEILEALGLSVARAAEALGVRRATLSDLLNGKAGLSPEMAFRIEKAFGVSMDTRWIRCCEWERGTKAMSCGSAEATSTSSAISREHEVEKGAAVRPGRLRTGGFRRCPGGVGAYRGRRLAPPDMRFPVPHGI